MKFLKYCVVKIICYKPAHSMVRVVCVDLDYECRERSAMTRILITSDRELGSNAAQRGAQVVRVNEFAELLGG